MCLTVTEAKSWFPYIRILSVVLVAALTACGSDQNRGYVVVHGWPRLPEGLILGQVSGVEVDSHDHIFVFHRGRSAWFNGDRPDAITEPTVLMLDRDSGTLISSWGAHMFLTPHGLTVDNSDNVWLTDVSRHQVFKFSHDGELLLTLGENGVSGNDATHFDGPTDAAPSPSGDIYISDGYGNNRVVRLTQEGEFLLQWGHKGTGAGEFNLPHGITVDRNGRVYIADRSNSRIQLFDPQGEFLAQWQSETLGRPWGLADGADNFLYVVDGGDPDPYGTQRARIHKTDTDGNIVETWGSYGQYDGQMDWAHDVAVDSDGNVYVADVHFGMRIQKFTK